MTVHPTTEWSSHNGFTSRLEVRDARPEDGGTYTCRVQDHNGHTNSRAVQVTVHSESTGRQPR